MSVIVTVSVPADAFTLGTALANDPGLEVTLEHVVPLGSTFIPYLWVDGHDTEAIERALGAAGDVDSFEIVDHRDGAALVRVEWTEDVDGLLDAFITDGATILEGVGVTDRWTFRLHFDDHADLTDFYQRCAAKDIDLDVVRIHDPAWPAAQGREFGITEPQREALQVALEEGYFDVPRRITLTELAGELGLSDSAVSQRIRRGTETILEQALADPPRTDGVVRAVPY